jgi:RNA polymerase sigma-70 factor (ECF subfamily)
MALDSAWTKAATAVSADDTAASDADLVASLGTDAQALAVLYDRHAGLVYGLALKILASAPEAEDLTQEVFVMLRHGSAYDPTRGSLTAYLVTYTRSRAIDRLRGRSRSRRLLEQWRADPLTATVAPSPLEALTSRERTTRVRDALATLPATQRTVLELAYYGGLSQTEIATEIEAPLGTVKTWARKGLATLRTLLGERGA